MDQREWLQTNGLGGYASSTVAGLNTRRYHGLLMAATKPPVGRVLLLSKLEETVVVEGRRYDLGTNQYPGVIHPEGYLLLKDFRQAPFPVFVYEVEGLRIEKSVFMVQGENTTVIEYRLQASGAMPASCALELRPLIAFRDYHSLTHENAALDPRVESDAGWVKVAPYAGMPALYLNHSGAEVQAAGFWFRNFEYARERERGLDFTEDLFNPMVLVFDLQRSPVATIVASTEKQTAAVAAPQASRQNVLERAAHQFRVQRGNETSVIAGYHWFSDWGRDTMISLPGLTLATGRSDAARSILRTFAASVDQGMLPNRFPDAGEAPEYNTVDATLWFFEAVRAYAANTQDYKFVRANLYAVLADIISWHERGTRYGIHVDSDGLVHAGEPGVALTWMDAKVGDHVITPRTGKPVEIQALWYNALRVMQDLARRFGYASNADHYRDLSLRARAAFAPLFWNDAARCLYDVVNGETRDASIRPNQIIAVSIFHQMLPPDKAKAVVDAVEQHLLTPYGLRTLAPSDPQYRGRYEGNPYSRDSAYHQGTVWPWLIGPFISAYLYVNAHATQAREQAGRWLQELLRYAGDEGLGQLPELFDGDAPHRAGGCIAQAWSVAELLRVMKESGLE